MTETTDAVRPPAQSAPALDLPKAQRQAAYEAFVASMAKRADGTLFLNHDQEHAEVVLAQLFRTAESDVKIVTGCLKDEVYGGERVSSAALRFANANPHTSLQVLHEYPIQGNRFVDLMTTAMGDRFALTEIGECPVNHFAVADGKHFRVETDKDHHNAFVAFGDVEMGTSLSNLFELVSDQSA